MRFQIRPKLRSKLTPALAALALSAAISLLATTAISTARADELTTPPAPSAAGSDSRPARGMSMEKVEATFGAPSNRTPAVGEPPISRWEYPGFVVYFEHRLVIHTVAIG
jgi:hypothetical protein